VNLEQLQEVLKVKNISNSRDKPLKISGFYEDSTPQSYTALHTERCVCDDILCNVSSLPNTTLFSCAAGSELRYVIHNEMCCSRYLIMYTPGTNEDGRTTIHCVDTQLGSAETKLPNSTTAG
jgi:hypothetical protein